MIKKLTMANILDFLPIPFPYSLLSSSWNFSIRLLTDVRMVPR